MNPPAAAVSRISTVVLIFWFLQALDVLTTILGIRLGAAEASFFISRLMALGVLPALLVAKGLALLLSTVALFQKRYRLLRILNYWFAGVVSWNLLMIYTSVVGR